MPNVLKPTAAEILPALQQAIRASLGADVVTATEVPVGFTRVDLLAAGAELWGFEIKSDRDTCGLLEHQIAQYSMVFDRCVLVTGRRHLERATEMLPDWWGVTLATPTYDGRVEITLQRSATPNPAPNVRSTVWLLWGSELRSALERRGIAHGVRGASRRVMGDRLIERLPADDVRAIVRDALRRRTDWRPIRSRASA